MSSYISAFRSWIVAALMLVAIEGAIYAVWRPHAFDRTNFLQFSFVRDETPQRLFVFHKVKEFASSNPTIVQSGDSSGFYGIEPAVVMRHLPAGVSYLNMSCCANLGYRGYYNIFEFMAERNNSIRYFVLHVTPYTMPRSELWDGDGAAIWGVPDVKVFGSAFHQEFMSHWRLLHLPSLAYRRQITDYIYYVGGLFNQLDRPLLRNKNYQHFLEVFRQTRGWMPETDNRVHVPPTECREGDADFFDPFTLSKKTYLQEILETYASMAKRYGVTLVVVFQPVACILGSGQGSAKAREVIDRFKRDHPEVEIPFPLIETWPSELFSVPAHIKREHTDLVGDRLGKAMAEIIARRGG
jgi:hypothetical protein